MSPSLTVRPGLVRTADRALIGGFVGLKWLIAAFMSLLAMATTAVPAYVAEAFKPDSTGLAATLTLADLPVIGDALASTATT
jgi:hypothetical protein